MVSLGELDKSLSTLDGIEEYALRQTSPDTYRLQLVSPRSDKNVMEEQAVSILRDLYGKDATIEIVFKAAIPPESSGKYSLAKTAFPVNIKNYLE